MTGVPYLFGPRGDISGVTIGASEIDANFAAITNGTIPLLVTATGTTTPRSLADRFAQVVNVKDEGAKGNNVTDDAAAINAAAALAYTIGCPLYFPVGTYRISTTILTAGISIIGEGLSTQIIPLAGFSSGADIIFTQPVINADLPFKYFQNITINPNGLGRRAIAFDFTNSGVFFAKFYMSGVFCLPGNDFSLYSNNPVGTNPNGNPYISAFENCDFLSGIKFVGGGDSLTFQQNAVQNTLGAAFDMDIVCGSLGPASNLVIHNNNGSGAGGFAVIRSSINTKFTFNNIDHASGAGSNGAVVDFDGSDNTNIDAAQMATCEAHGNKIALFGGTATTAIRVNNCSYFEADNNDLIAGVAKAQAILITSLATDTKIGDSNAYAEPGVASNWVVPITDNSTIPSVTPFYVATTPVPVPGSGAFGAGLTCAVKTRRDKSEWFFQIELTIPDATAQGTAATNIAVPMSFTAPREVTISALKKTIATGASVPIVAEMLPGGPGPFVYLTLSGGGYPGGAGIKILVSGYAPYA